jgi:metal-responsive CopG/Arc/MetJ family transcriptional regulator
VNIAINTRRVKMKKYKFSSIYIGENISLWNEFKNIAKSYNLSTSELIMNLIREYVRDERDDTL